MRAWYNIKGTQDREVPILGCITIISFESLLMNYVLSQLCVPMPRCYAHGTVPVRSGVLIRAIDPSNY